MGTQKRWTPREISKIRETSTLSLYSLSVFTVSPTKVLWIFCTLDKVCQDFSLVSLVCIGLITTTLFSATLLKLL